MGILIDEKTRVLVQGITGREGTYHTRQMINYGTNIVGGVTPGKGGEWFEGKPIFETVQTAVNATGANTSIIFVPPVYAADAIYEAIDAGIELIICITEGIPLLDSVRVREYIRNTPSRLVGPNCPGILVPGLANVGIIPAEITLPGSTGVVSRSGTLAYEITYMLTRHNIGQSTIVGIGGDPVIGTSFVSVLDMFEDDPQTERIVLIGEIGGRTELDAAAFIQAKMTKPVFAYIVGKSAPLDLSFGHGAALSESVGTDAQTKIMTLAKAGAKIVTTPEEIAQALTNPD